MLLNMATLDGIVDGRIDLVFRRWRQPTVKTGGRQRTARGELSILAVEVIDPVGIDDEQARRAGFESADAVRHELFRERSGSGRGRVARPDETSLVYRVTVAFAGVDQRAALRDELLDGAALAGVVDRLAAMDRRSARGAWTFRTLDLIRTWPARRAPELAEMDGCETIPWKTEVRRLKELGLTESLRVGYRLSPRGEQVVAELDRRRS